MIEPDSVMEITGACGLGPLTVTLMASLKVSVKLVLTPLSIKVPVRPVEEIVSLRVAVFWLMFAVIVIDIIPFNDPELLLPKLYWKLL